MKTLVKASIYVAAITAIWFSLVVMTAAVISGFSYPYGFIGFITAFTILAGSVIILNDFMRR